MAVKSRSQFSLWRALHFVMRFIGLNGLVACAVGAFLWQALDQELVGMIVLIAGGAAVGLALLAEVHGFVQALFSHRGAAGINVFFQVAMAAALVVAGNYYAFEHYRRFDCTEKQVFTLDENLRDKLAQLRGDTDIIVYVQHVSFGQRIELRQDEYDQAAEKIIIKKVEDLAEQFSELGPRFRVHIIDRQKKNYKKVSREKINKISGELSAEQLAYNRNPTKEHPALDSELLKTIEKAAENSIFFYSADSRHLQRLSFNDIYHLDKQASEEANDKKGNLVLIDQGVRNFANKVFKIEEKKPRIGFAVVHEVLGHDGREDLGMPGLKAALPTRDMEGRDIVLWKRLQIEAAALEHKESRHELLVARIKNYERLIKGMEDYLEEARKDKKYWETTSIDDINKEYVLVPTIGGVAHITRKRLEEERKRGNVLPTKRIPDEYKTAEIEEWVEIIDATEVELAVKKERLEKTKEEKKSLPVENLDEQRRIADVRAKFNRLLADVDMLVVPRPTFFNLLRRDRIPSRVYPLADAHIDSIKDFMKAGKPVLFLLGPMHAGEDERPFDPADDSIEKLLASFDIQLPNQAILYSSEEEAMEETRERSGPPGGAFVDIPPAEFDWKKSPGSRVPVPVDGQSILPIRASMKLTVRALGDKSRDGLKLRHPRPVYVVRANWSPETIASALGAQSLGWPAGSAQTIGEFYTKVNKKLDSSTVFLMTDVDSWNEERPIPSDDWAYTPRFKHTKADNVQKGTVQEKRKGPFPIGVALEAEVPRDWYEGNVPRKPVKVRLAVIGQGGVFIGEKLPPLREKLFLDVSNWLLGRENLLTQESTTWQYPRVEMEPETKKLWEWGARLGLPLLFVYFGVIVGLVRRMR